MRQGRKRMVRSMMILVALFLLIPVGTAVLVQLVPALSTAAFPWQGWDEPVEYLPTEAAGSYAEQPPALYVSHGYGAVEETNPAEELQTETVDPGPKPYPETWDLSGGTVQQMTYVAYRSSQYINLKKAGQVLNKTSVSNDKLYAESLLLPEFSIETNGDPQVLIMHTHTTETYEPYERDSYDASFNYRTTDSSKNMVMVGDAIAAQLEAAGIGVIHDTTIHDYPSYTGSYGRSAETVKAILEEYPSIKVVLDIHRDAISSDGVISQPVAEINGRKAAQVMIIAGCDDGTMGMPQYMKNFRFACLLQQQMESDYPGLTRPILFDYRKYNQDLTTGSILIEVGSHGNTLEQAEYSGELIGTALAEALLSLPR